MAVLLGVAFAVAREKKKSWAQLALIGLTVTVSIAIALTYSSYLPWLPWIQLAVGIGAASAVLLTEDWELSRTWWVSLVAGVSMLLTPAAWTIDTVNHTNAINPVAGGGANAMGGPGGMGGSSGMRGPGGMPGGANGMPGGLPGNLPGGMPAGGMGAGMGATNGPGMGAGLSNDTLAYLTENRGSAKYLVATFGAQSAASIITSTGESVLPIGGFDGQDPYPSLEAFQSVVSSGELRFVLAGGRTAAPGGMGGLGGPGMNGAPGTSSAASGSATATGTSIQSWVSANCALVTDSRVTSGVLYDCAPAQ
jgi:hypothetical protein